MRLHGNLAKMQGALTDPVKYELPIGDKTLTLNHYLGASIKLSYEGVINCVHCGREIKKSFNQGFCYPCFRRLAQCDICYVRPELCHYGAGTCREPKWADVHCMRTHIVYLSNTSGLKIGITRASQIPTRWIDQGATQALAVFEVDQRYHSGRIETLFKAHISDRTDWRRMLKGVADPIDLTTRRNSLLALVSGDLSTLQKALGRTAIRPIENPGPVSIAYPVQSYPKTVKALSFDKTPVISGVLMGIKGQYLILQNGVLNIRKFGGYRVSLEAN